jgi:hypothetical protein
MLPNASKAVVEPSKVRDYLLSRSHPVGRFKAVVFLALGYTQENWEKLRDDLLAIARTGEAVPAEPSTYGQKYEVSGKLTWPNGQIGHFKTIWLVEAEKSVPRFLTAYPG